MLVSLTERPFSGRSVVGQSGQTLLQLVKQEMASIQRGNDGHDARLSEMATQLTEMVISNAARFEELASKIEGTHAGIVHLEAKIEGTNRRILEMDQHHAETNRAMDAKLEWIMSLIQGSRETEPKAAQ